MFRWCDVSACLFTVAHITEIFYDDVPHCWIKEMSSKQQILANEFKVRFTKVWSWPLPTLNGNSMSLSQRSPGFYGVSIQVLMLQRRQTLEREGWAWGGVFLKVFEGLLTPRRAGLCWYKFCNLCVHRLPWLGVGNGRKLVQEAEF